MPKLPPLKIPNKVKVVIIAPTPVKTTTPVVTTVTTTTKKLLPGQKK